jgi:hypothetical protein
MTEPQPAPDPTESTAPETPEITAEERAKTAASRYESERRKASRLEKELNALRAGQLSESEKAIEEARVAGRKEGARSAGVRLVAAEFRAKAAEAKLPGVGSLLDVIDLTKFVDDDGEPDTELIQAAIDKIADGLAAADNGRAKVKAPEIPKGVRPKVGDDDWIRSIVDQG